MVETSKYGSEGARAGNRPDYPTTSTSTRKRTSTAEAKGVSEDEEMKFVDVVLRVQAPPGQSIASRSVASLAVSSAMAGLMRGWASE